MSQIYAMLTLHSWEKETTSIMYPMDTDESMQKFKEKIDKVFNGKGDYESLKVWVQAYVQQGKLDRHAGDVVLMLIDELGE
jgi:hypothetical protein